MSHDHHHATPVTAGARHLRALAIALGLTATFLLVEAAVGFGVGSLALISDAGHMLTDTLGLAMALAAVTMAQRPANDRRTYGNVRWEALAALANATLLFGVAAYVLYEAVGRFRDPTDVPGLALMVVAALGLLVNVVAFLLLRAGARESLNVRGAFLEVLADMIGSVGVLAAGAVTLTTGWAYADPVVGVAIGLFVLPRAARLGRDAVRILLEGTPERVDVSALRTQLQALPGVADVHDLHVWSLTSGSDIATAHVRLDYGADGADVLRRATLLLHDDFAVSHVTVQIESADHTGPEPVH